MYGCPMLIASLEGSVISSNMLNALTPSKRLECSFDVFPGLDWLSDFRGDVNNLLGLGSSSSDSSENDEDSDHILIGPSWSDSPSLAGSTGDGGRCSFIFRLTGLCLRFKLLLPGKFEGRRLDSKILSLITGFLELCTVDGGASRICFFCWPLGVFGISLKEEASSSESSSSSGNLGQFRQIFSFVLVGRSADASVASVFTRRDVPRLGVRSTFSSAGSHRNRAIISLLY